MGKIISPGTLRIMKFMWSRSRDWARQNFADCSMAVFDMVSNEKTEYTRVYTRYTAAGSLVLSDETGTMERLGELIYEFMYPGSSFKGHM